MATYILVHGAWLDRRCWDLVTPALRAAGHTVVAPDLPGHGDDTTPLAGQTLDAYAARVTAEVDAAAQPVILVGHSMGGIVISTVAERRPAKIARLVYLAAYLLKNGESIQTTQDADSKVPPAMRPAADWSTIALDPAMMPEIFFHDVPAGLTAAAVKGSKPEASAAFGTPLALTDANWGRVPRAYIHTTLDRAVSASLQKQMLAATPCDPVLELATGHAPFFAAPELLSRQLLQLTA
jgi:pimeloyl-ACP methyl ester carboxylesterase